MTPAEVNETYHAFTVLQEISPTNSGTLDGTTISVKDNILVKDVETTACSRILKGYKPAFDATAVSRLRAAGATIVGKTSMDAFGFGSWNLNPGLDYPIPKNPRFPGKVPGGSSGGAAIAAATLPNHVALAESTGGSIETPACCCGVIGYCPAYGAVSRHGLISYADSLDKIGIMAQAVDQLIPVLNVITGPDSMDGTTLQEPIKLSAPEKLRVGVIKEGMHDVAQEVQEAVQASIKKLGNSCEIVDISLPITMKYGVAAYYLISTSEASTNLARFCGLRYGQHGNPKHKGFNEYFSSIRSEHFNTETKRRILLGTYARMAGYRDAYYVKAQAVRKAIRKEYTEALEKVDVLVSPTLPIVAPDIEEATKLTPAQTYAMDRLTVGPNMAGLPHASIPVSKQPISILATAQTDGALLAFLKKIEAQ